MGKTTRVPKGANIHRLWLTYQRNLQLFEQIANLIADDELDNDQRIGYISSLISHKNGKYRAGGSVPLSEYCYITGLKYDTIIGRMNNKCMTVDEAIAYGWHKKQRQEEKAIYAKRIKQRQHMLAIVDHLASQVVDNHDEETDEDGKGAGI